MQVVLPLTLPREIRSIKTELSNYMDNQPTSPTTPEPTSEAIRPNAKPKFSLKSLLPVLALALVLPALVASTQIRKLVGTSANTTPITRVQINPGEISVGTGSEAVNLSALAFDANNQPVNQDVNYVWGISSTNSIGNLIPNPNDTKLAQFIPSQNAGVGDIYVEAFLGSDRIRGSIPVRTIANANVCPEDLAVGLINRDSYYGYVKINGSNAPLGTDIKLYSPRNELVGCGKVTLPNGGYPMINAWGTEPGLFEGMRTNEAVTFKVNTQVATYSVPLWTGSLLTTQVDLSLGSAPTSTPTITLYPTITPTAPTPTNTPKVSPASPTPTRKVATTPIVLPISATPQLLPSPTPRVTANMPPSISTVVLWPAITGLRSTYSATINAADSNAGDILTITMPTTVGLSIGSCARQTNPAKITCRIQGRPTKAGVHTLKVTVTDGRGGTAVRSFLLGVIGMGSIRPPSPY